MRNVAIMVVVVMTAGFSTPARPSSEAASAKTRLFEVGEFRRIYSPVDGAGNPWWINDHCFMCGDDGTWHLIGITQRQEPNDFFQLVFDDARIGRMTEQERAGMLAEVAELRAKAAESGVPIFDNLGERQLAHATADSLLQSPWRTEPFALVADEETWGENVLWAPHIVRHDGLYHMFYAAGGDFEGGLFRIHLVTSPDMKSWTRHEANPLFIDGFHARDPMVLKIGDEWVMYYTANSDPAGGNHIVAFRTSPDLVKWSDRGTAFTDPTIGTSGGPTESPFVVRRGRFYYLFLSMRHGYIPGHYADTGVFRSTDPFHWDVDHQVGEIRAHAAEVIRDVDGGWCVSHCGWYQGGAYLAPLIWHDGQDESDTSMPVPGIVDRSGASTGPAEGATKAIVTLKPGDSYFTVNGRQRFLFGRNPVATDQSLFDTFFGWAAESGEKVMRIHLTHGRAPRAEPGEVDEDWAVFWDGVFDRAAQRDLFILPVFGVWADWNDGSNSEIWHGWDRNPYNQALGGPAQSPSELFGDTETRRLYLGWLEKLVTRWQGRSNIVGWEIFSELDLVTGSTEPEGVGFVEAAAAVIRAADGYHRPITASLKATASWPLLFQSDGMDIIQTHPYSVGSRFGGRLDELIIYSVRERLGYGKPVLIGESGLDPRGADVGLNVLPRAHIGIRHGIWASTVSGAMNGRMLWWEDGYGRDDQVDLSTAYRHASIPVTNVVKDLDFTDFAPVALTTSGELIGAAVGNDRTALAWVRDSHCILPEWPVRSVAGEKLTLEVAGENQSWRISFFDGVTGTLVETASAERRGGKVLVLLPTFEDSLAVILEPAPPSS